jgi:hypothetical protein
LLFTMLLLVRIYLAATDDNGRRFSHHCPRQASVYIKKERSIEIYQQLL